MDQTSMRARFTYGGFTTAIEAKASLDSCKEPRTIETLGLPTCLKYRYA